MTSVRFLARVRCARPQHRSLGAAILLVVLKANQADGIVSEGRWAHWLAGPFDGMFSFHSANTAIAVNWGIAAVVYLSVGRLIVQLFDRSLPRPPR